MSQLGNLEIIDLDKFVNALKINPMPKPVDTLSLSIETQLDTIRNSGISGIETRQDDLVNLMVMIVNECTDSGNLTDSIEYPKTQGYWDDVMKYTREAGFKLLGAGYFSAAFSHAMLPNRVIKVGFKVEDSGATYAAWCRQNQGLYGIPVIYDLQRHDGCYTVVLDKLNEFNTYSESIPERIKELYLLAERVLDGRKHEKPIDADSKALAETMSKIREFFEGMARFDLHEDNVMIHPKTGELVITDPVSFTNKAMKISKDANGFMVDLEEIIEAVKSAKLEEFKERCRERNERRRSKNARRKEIRLKRKRKLALKNSKVSLIRIIDLNKYRPSNIVNCSIYCRNVACEHCPVYQLNKGKGDVYLGDIRKVYQNLNPDMKKKIREDILNAR